MRPHIRARTIARLVGIVIMLLPLVLVPSYFFVTNLVPSQPARTLPLTGGAIALAPDTPMVAPGQTQNYSILTVSVPSSESVITTLRAFSPQGLSFQMNRTTLAARENASVPVTITASPSLTPGDYRVEVEESEGEAARNQTFTVDVVPALVVMLHVSFQPASISVAPGTTVYWINLDSVIGCCDPGYHDVSFQGGGMNVTSPILRRLDTWSYTFETPGTFYYDCTIHPWMVGVVYVGSGSREVSASGPSPATTGVQVSIPPGAVDPSNAPGYSPDKIVVVIGVNNTVTWVNDDSAPHTVTSTSVPAGAIPFDSGELVASETYSYTFTVPGTYEYHCGYHPWMTGTVVVEAGP